MSDEKEFQKAMVVIGHFVLDWKIVHMKDFSTGKEAWEIISSMY